MATHPRLAPRRGARATTWWGKAWVRAVEEAAYGERDLLRGRTLARSGLVGAITVEPGRFLAAVEEGDDVVTVSGAVPMLETRECDAFAETVAAEAGRIGALMSGELPHGLVEHAEELGVELLPYGGELMTRCSCEPWTDPCPHALAVLYQLTWLLEADPFVLLALRGLERDDLLARLHTATTTTPGHPPGQSPGQSRGPTSPQTPVLGLDADVARDAADRARLLLATLADPDSPTVELGVAHRSDGHGSRA